MRKDNLKVHGLNIAAHVFHSLILSDKVNIFFILFQLLKLHFTNFISNWFVFNPFRWILLRQKVSNRKWEISKIIYFGLNEQA